MGWNIMYFNPQADTPTAPLITPTSNKPRWEIGLIITTTAAGTGVGGATAQTTVGNPFAGYRGAVVKEIIVAAKVETATPTTSSTTITNETIGKTLEAGIDPIVNRKITQVEKFMAGNTVKASASTGAGVNTTVTVTTTQIVRVSGGGVFGRII
jgi:hypothetical protein